MERIYGVSLEQLAAFTAKYSELQAKYGTLDSRAAFEHWLVTQDSDLDSYERAHNAWSERFRADSSGRLYARYTRLETEHSPKALFGELRDMSQDTLAGVTLERYAELTVALADSGLDAEVLARQHGIEDAAQWLRVNAAWSRALSEDSEQELSQQFGRLHRRFAGAAVLEQQMLATAAILEEANRAQASDEETDLPDTPDSLLQKLSSSSRKGRWRAARRLAHSIDVGAARGARYRAACVPALLEIVDRYADQSTSDAEHAASLLLDLAERTPEVKTSITRCLLRAEEKLSSLRAALGSIQDQALSERIVLQNLIGDYSSLIASLRANLADLRDIPSSAGRSSASESSLQRRGGYGLGLTLPLVAGLLLVIGVLSLWLYQKNSPTVSLNAATVALDRRALGMSGATAGASSRATDVSSATASAKSDSLRQRTQAKNKN